MICTVNSNLVESVFFLKFGASTGSAFTLTLNENQYLVSAKHIFKEISHKSQITVELFHENVWKQITAELYFHPKDKIDVFVITLPQLIAPKYQFSTDAQLLFGQDLFMLGFPYGLYQDSGDINRNFPLPFVKKAAFSAASAKDEYGTMYFLDGHNNKGFSGGPVCYYQLNEKKAYIVDVISGYIPQQGSISTPFGDWKYNENSGIVISYGIKSVIEIIDAITKP
jgi:hypothetical protein